MDRSQELIARSIKHYSREAPGFEDRPGISGACKGQIGLDIIINAQLAWRGTNSVADRFPAGAHWSGPWGECEAIAARYLASLNL
jgi:hypothetical protein